MHLNVTDPVFVYTIFEPKMVAFKYYFKYTSSVICFILKFSFWVLMVDILHVCLIINYFNLRH